MNFEALFTKFDHGEKDGLSWKEIIEMLIENRQLFDFIGWGAAAFEWGFLYWLAADNGVLKRSTILGMYDGSLFYRIAAERAGKQPVDKSRLYNSPKKDL